MPGDDWNILAGRLTGDGFVTGLIGELPIKISSIERRVSAPSLISGSITNAVRRLQGSDGRLLLEPKNTVIIAEASGRIKSMGIYQKPTFNGANWDISAIGLPGYAIGKQFVGDQEFIDADPLDIFRLIWDNLQSQPAGNLGITIDTLLSGKKVGTPKTDVDFTTNTGADVSFEAGPRKLAWHSTHDLGAEIDKYAKATPFDWLEQVYWAEDDQPHCHIRLGHPTIGASSNHPRLELGVNLATAPSVTGVEYFNEVIVLGAGEGPDRIRGHAGISDGRLREPKIIEDKNLDKVADANALAAETLNSLRGGFIVDTLEVWDHPDMPLESYELGNSYPLYAETEHVTVDDSVRLVARSDVPGGEEKATFTVIRQVTA